MPKDPICCTEVVGTLLETCYSVNIVVMSLCLETYPESICLGTGSHGHEVDLVTGMLLMHSSKFVTIS